MRVGIGYDVHRFAEGRKLILAGVEFPHETGLEGHSDADVVTHAVIDALLGAAGLGDIGGRFPDDDPRWRDASSLDLLGDVVGLLELENYHVVNVDVCVVAERPRIAAHAQAMRQRLGERLAIGPDFVSVKATTAEKLGAIGREEGIAAWAAALIDRIDEPGLP